MNIQNLKSNTTWQEASNTINNNNNKISLAIATLENAKLKNKGYFTTVEKLNEAIPNPTIGSKAYVGTSEPYAIYIVENGAWVDSGYTGGNELVAKITTDRIEDGAVTTEKIATSAFDSTLSVSGKIAPADVVGAKLNELDIKVGELVGIDEVIVDFNSVPKIDGVYANANKTWTIIATYKNALISVGGYKSFEIQNGVGTLTYGYLKNDEIINGQNLPFCEGKDGMMSTNGVKDIPSDCKYLLIAISTPTEDKTPSLLKFEATEGKIGGGQTNSEAMLNLLNQDACLPNTAFSGKNNGETKTSNGWSITDYIALEPNTSYFIYGCYLPNFYCFYDSDKNVLSATNVEITYSSDQYKGIINVGDEKVYFRGSWLNGKTNPYVSQYVDKYTPYGEKDYSYLSPKLNEDIENLKKESKETLNLNLFDVTKITDNASISNNGTTKENSAWAVSDFIKLKANTKYYSFGFYLETFFAVYTLDKVVTSATKVTLQFEGTNKVLGTIMVGSEDVLVRMSWLKSNANPYISQYINAYRPFGTSDYSFVSPYLLKSNSIANKKVTIIGDSISAYNYAYYNKWTQALQNEGFLPQDMTNSSIHATGFVTDGSYAGGTRTGDNFPTRLKAIETPNIYDYAIIFGGVNDYIQAVPIADFTTAVNDFFEYLVKNFINASIMVVLPLYRANHGANAIGKTEDDYIAIIKNAAKTYHLPILNATDESGFYADVDEFKTRWTNQGDGLHPNEEWSRTRLAPYIRSFIESHLKY